MTAAPSAADGRNLEPKVSPYPHEHAAFAYLTAAYGPTASAARRAAELHAFGPHAAAPLRGVVTMGKYFVGWLLGVPVVVLAVVYLLFHH